MKTRVPGLRNTSRSKDENQQQTQPTYDAESGNRTRATLVGGECSHPCAIPHSHEKKKCLQKVEQQALNKTRLNVSYFSQSLSNRFCKHNCIFVKRILLLADLYQAVILEGLSSPLLTKNKLYNSIYASHLRTCLLSWSLTSLLRLLLV